MNAHTSITPGSVKDVNLTRLMLRNDIEAITRYSQGRFAVRLQDGRVGVGLSVGEALDKALADDPMAALAALRAA